MLCIRSGHQHSTRLYTTHIPCLQIGKNNDLFALKMFKRDVVDKATAYDSGFRLTNINLFHIKRISLFVFPCSQNLTNPYVKQRRRILNTDTLLGFTIAASWCGLRHCLLCGGRRKCAE
uniref:Uncharacterized protein n=1 Tax=Lotus japonicus TaxID=34305 RepID=I3SL81_LOTJA|nr:unknown [Lotus japonicus]